MIVEAQAARSDWERNRIELDVEMIQEYTFVVED
jgi:hypothetical protein